jgi:hypothetical protein
MLAYGEPNAAENWARLNAIAPSHLPAPRLVENIPGLYASHAACARMSRTPFFFLIDADNWILDGFDFSVPSPPASGEILLWGATNPFNGLYYGHGGMKLLPAALFEKPETAADAESSLDYIVTMAPNRFIDLKASEHRFNTGAYGTWGAVFRECVKLTAAAQARTGLKRRAIARYRLEQWCTVNPAARFAEWCRLGAVDGIAYGRKFHGDHAKLKRINDFAWLRAAFLRRQDAIAVKPAFDVFMIAYGEKHAAANWARLQQIVPGAKLVENVSGAVACYAACAAAAGTDHFFVVDGDTWLLDDFRFDLPFMPAPGETVFWSARNPVNGLEYGNGAIKLLPRAPLLKNREMLEKAVDFAMELGPVRYTGICASEHRFNADPYSAWLAAFRECAKLAVGTTIGNDEARALAKRRLDAWCGRYRKDAAFADWCLKGAADGRDFGLAHVGDPVALAAKLNSYAWLRATFAARHAGQPLQSAGAAV